MNDTWPPDAPRDKFYLCFSPATDEDAAAAKFKERHGGKPPEFVFEARGYLRLGPVPGGAGAQD